MKNDSPHEKDSTKGVSGIHQTPPRVAHRMEGVVKNVGTKPKKKEPKHTE